MEKPFKMVIQVLFYSVGIFLIFLAMGKLPDYAFETFYKHMFFTPVASSHYWFASMYIFFYLTAPFLAVGLRRLNKTQHLGLVVDYLLGLLPCLFAVYQHSVAQLCKDVHSGALQSEVAVLHT